jgi:hypothetical protein
MQYFRTLLQLMPGGDPEQLQLLLRLCTATPQRSLACWHDNKHNQTSSLIAQLQHVQSAVQVCQGSQLWELVPEFEMLQGSATGWMRMMPQSTACCNNSDNESNRATCAHD